LRGNVKCLATIASIAAVAAVALAFSRALYEEVFKEKLSFAPMERAAAANACYFAILRGRRGSDPGKFVSCLAIGTVKRDWL
jgi:hypothetical protein